MKKIIENLKKIETLIELNIDSNIDDDFASNVYKITNDTLIETKKLPKTFMVCEDLQIIVSNSGYVHAPYLVTWVDAYEDCGANILTREQVKEKYDVEV